MISIAIFHLFATQSLFDGFKSMDKFMERKCVDDLKQRYFGRIIDNFECNDPNLHRSLCDSMNEYLFYHVVDSPKTAMQILAGFNAAKLPGEVNFFALNIIDTDEFERPEILSHFKFDAKFQKVFEKIFSELSFDLNGFQSREASLHSADLGCEFIEENGSFRGIKIVNDNSVELYQEQQQLADVDEATHYEISENACRMQATVQSINKTSQILDERRMTLSQIQQIQSSLADVTQAVNASNARIHSKRNDMQKHEAKLQEITETKVRYENELALDFLTPQEKKTVEATQAAIVAKRSRIQEMSSEISRLIEKRRAFSDFLKRKVMNQYNELEAQSVIYSNNSTELIRQEQKLAQVEETKRKAETSLSGIRAQMHELSGELASMKLMLKELNDAKSALQVKQQNMFAEMDTKKAHHTILTAELNRLKGLKPYDATHIHNEDIIGLSENDIDNQLNIAQHQIKTYQNTNCFDLRLLDTFTKDKEDFNRRRAELTQFESKISTAMEKLEMSISEAIRNTFGELAKHFSANFMKFVPGGSARLHLVEAPINQMENGRDHEIVGVDIFVRFQQTEKRFADLLGHERKLVALVFIISVQQVGASSFYLIHNIDKVIENFTSFLFAYLEFCVFILFFS